MGTASDLRDFVLGDMVRLASSLRALAPTADNLEDYAGRLCTHLHESFVDDDHGRQALLVRLYLTQPLSALPDIERAFASPRPEEGDPRCLTLLGSAGDVPEWNDRRRSRGHLAIPLHDTERVAALPMVAGLLKQMGIDVAALIRPDGLVMNPNEHRYGVFHVAEAAGSPLIPGQDFVAAYGVRSVLGFGGVLPDGEMYAVVLFARVPVSREVAGLLETLSPSITLALVERLGLPVFADPTGLPRSSGTNRAEVREALLRSILEVHERVAAQESDRARRAVAEATREAGRSATLARTLQSSLLPLELPKISGLQSRAHFQPAGDGSEIGGDFYDLFPVRRGVWGMVLGDVSGKGAGAASLTALARHTVRAAAFGARTCVEVMQVLNEAAYRQEIAEERYLTAAFAFLTRTGPVVQVDLCLGGHECPLLLRRDEVPEDVGVLGQPLGLFHAPELAPARIAMRRGDTLLAYTDGVTDARNGTGRFGAGRLVQTVTELAGNPVGEIVMGLADAVRGFQGDLAADDIAIIGVQSTR